METEQWEDDPTDLVSDPTPLDDPTGSLTELGITPGRIWCDLGNVEAAYVAASRLLELESIECFPDANNCVLAALEPLRQLDALLRQQAMRANLDAS